MIDARNVAAAVFATTLFAAVGVAHDRWETIYGGSTSDDQPGATYADSNVLTHGVIQTHDLEGSLAAPDQDWMLVPTTARHSYEAKLSGFSAFASYGVCSACVQVARVNAAGATLTGQSNPFGSNGAVAVRWTATSAQSDYIRVTGHIGANPPTANDQYTIEFFDTTQFITRFNNSGTQITVLFIQNTTRATVTGSIYFYAAGGGLTHTEPLNVAVQGLQVVNTTAIGALAGASGSVAIAHNGGYGALNGKAVALEPATGFSFDSPLVVLPR